MMWFCVRTFMHLLFNFCMSPLPPLSLSHTRTHAHTHAHTHTHSHTHTHTRTHARTHARRHAHTHTHTHTYTSLNHHHSQVVFRTILGPVWHVNAKSTTPAGNEPELCIKRKQCVRGKQKGKPRKENNREKKRKR